MQQPLGFAPSEISALVNGEVVAQHAEEAAFLWTLRQRAVAEPHYALKDLVVLDQRVEAHLDGLRVAGDAGWRCCKANLENIGAGEVFALSVVVFGGKDRERMTEALHAACTSQKFAAGLISAFGWLDFDVAAPWIDRLLDAKAPMHRAIGIRASAIHRRDPGPALVEAVAASDAGLCVAALRAVGELKRKDLTGHVQARLRDADGAVAFWAAWALAMNGEPQGVTALSRWFEDPGPVGFRALQLGLRAMSLDEGRGWISASAKTPAKLRQAVIATGILGDPTSIPWLIRKMESPDLARLAGEAFSMITGVDLTYHDLDQDAPGSAEVDDAEDIEQVLDLDYESNLPWPAPERIDGWWAEHQHAFTPGVRHLAAKPINRQSAVEVLVSGKQRQRIAAALELTLLAPESPFFEVRAVGRSQERELAAWTS